MKYHEVLVDKMVGVIAEIQQRHPDKLKELVAYFSALEDAVYERNYERKNGKKYCKLTTEELKYIQLLYEGD